MAGPMVGGGDPKKSESANARATALVGRTISDRYRIVDLVAMGAMGAVYKGEHLLMRKQVAIKVLHPEIEDFPELVARFEREAIAGAHVNHPNVASASDFGKFDGDSYFLILEYIEGETLGDLIKRGAVEPVRATKILKQVAAALGAAHERGIVHRDVKPKNIMICAASSKAAAGADDDVVKLIDFGLAKVPVEKLSELARDPTTDGKELTNAGVVMGTVAYMAPETAYGMAAVDARADLYALGVIAYEMLAGKHLFDAVEPQKLFAAHVKQRPQPFRQRNPDVYVPDDLERIVMRLLEKDPTSRFPNADALISALEAFRMRVAVNGPLPTGPRPAPNGPSSIDTPTIRPGAPPPPRTIVRGRAEPEEKTRIYIAGGIGALLVVVVLVLVLVAR